MVKYKFIILFLTFIFSCYPVFFSIGQTEFSTQSSNENEVIQNDNNNSYYEYKKEKKKKKDNEKNEIELNNIFFINLLINIISVIIIVVFIYYPNYHKQDVFFTFFLFNITIFLLTFLLNKVKISMGAAFGLFAVFSMLRYRTEGISMKDMTYLFIVIAIGLVSAIQLEYYELAIINGIIIFFTFLLDGNILMEREYTKNIYYENIELIKPENYELLISDLKQRTGLNIHRISIKNIDYLKDSANIEIYYKIPKNITSNQKISHSIIYNS